MKMIGTPLVYVGPTLSAEAVQRAYPDCIVRPPVARGDLYRDRMLRGAVFLILDGVFFQNLAISPREILDVIADGAFVAGASSMGALRAAECWPAGMRGVGSVYRLFQSGALDSDDEVAVTFTTGPAGLLSSVALINVRYAARCAQRAGIIDADSARAIVGAARHMFYADRYWPQILRAAGVHDRTRVAAELARYDLKALDATRALARLARWTAADPTLFARPRASGSGFVASDVSRERPHDARASSPVMPNDLRVEFARWVFASGRYRRHAGPLAAAMDGARTTPKAEGGPAAAAGARAREGVDAALTDYGVLPGASTRAAHAAIARAAARTRSLFRAFVADEAAHAEHVWLALAMAEELDAELFRFRALCEAEARFAQTGVATSLADRHAAELKIATTHGHASWTDLLTALQDCPVARELVVQHSQRATAAGAASNTS